MPVDGKGAYAPPRLFVHVELLLAKKTAHSKMIIREEKGSATPRCVPYHGTCDDTDCDRNNMEMVRVAVVDFGR